MGSGAAHTRRTRVHICMPVQETPFPGRTLVCRDFEHASPHTRALLQVETRPGGRRADGEEVLGRMVDRCAVDLECAGGTGNA
jgi:hypothetical protein